MKTCRTCKIEKPLVKYRLQRGFYVHQCLDCDSSQKKEWVKKNFHAVNESNKEYNKKNAHIIRGNKLVQYWPGTNWETATEEYNKLHDKQVGVCALCHRPERRVHVKTGVKWDLAVDHCHTTNKVRGLLCNACNRGLGLLGDPAETLKRVLDYLTNHQK